MAASDFKFDSTMRKQIKKRLYGRQITLYRRASVARAGAKGFSSRVCLKYTQTLFKTKFHSLALSIFLFIFFCGCMFKVLRTISRMTYGNYSRWISVLCKHSFAAGNFQYGQCRSSTIDPLFSVFNDQRCLLV